MPKKSDKRKQKKWFAKPSMTNAGTMECWFCKYNIQPDYKDVDVLHSFLSPRGKILSRQITSTCAKCQRKLTKAVKNARQMALVR